MDKRVGKSWTLIISIIVISTSYATAQAPVPLATSGDYVILAQAGITTTGQTTIVGNIGISPASSTAITGFTLVPSQDGTYSTSAMPPVTGNIYAADYANPTPAKLRAAILDFTAAYNNAAGRSNPKFLDLQAGNLNGANLTEGLYKWNTGLTLGGTITFSGNAKSVFIFQISGTLVFSANCRVVLSGGVLSNNIFYQVSGQVSLAAQAAAQGIILGKTGISLATGASLNSGRALAGTAVTMSDNNVRQPLGTVGGGGGSNGTELCDLL